MVRQYIEGFMDMENDLDTLLRIHLQGNHYPPVHPDFIPACKEAIAACNEENYNKKIKMCNGITKTAYEIVEGLHLDSFLDQEDY